MTREAFDQLAIGHLDGSLDAEGTRRLEQALTDEALRARFVELATQGAMLRELLTAAPAPSLARGRWPRRAALGALAAAALLAVVLTGWRALDRGKGASSASAVASSASVVASSAASSLASSSEPSSAGSSSAASSSASPRWTHLAVVRVISLAPLRVRRLRAIDGELPDELTLDGAVPDGIALDAELRVRLRRDGEVWVLVGWEPR